MIYLDEPSLGTLLLRDQPEGYDVASFQIGFPEVRTVVQPRALQDGADDYTMYLGQRAVTISMYLDQRRQSTQGLLDLLLPYLSPRYRPRMIYTVQDIAAGCPVLPLPAPRALGLRGADAPVVINGPRFQTITCQWVADTYATGVDERCFTFLPSSDEEDGRTYDLTFDRSYPATYPSGFQIINNAGNAPADWRMTIFGPFDDVRIDINTATILTSVTVAAGDTLVIDTAARTIRINDDPSASRYGSTNFGDWTWDDLMLQPGNNAVRFQAINIDDETRATICWRDTYV